MGENRTAINDHQTTLLVTLVEETATDNQSVILYHVPQLTHCPSTHLYLVSLRIKIKGEKCSSVTVEKCWDGQKHAKRRKETGRSVTEVSLTGGFDDE